MAPIAKQGASPGSINNQEARNHINQLLQQQKVALNQPPPMILALSIVASYFQVHVALF